MPDRPIEFVGDDPVDKPDAYARGAEIGSPVSSISRAALAGTARTRGTIGVVQKSPILTPGVENVAPSAATARSHAATSWQPAAAAMALDARDDRLRQPMELHHHPRAEGEQGLVVRLRTTYQLVQVMPGTEDRAPGGDDHDAHRRVVGDLEQGVSSS